MVAALLGAGADVARTSASGVCAAQTARQFPDVLELLEAAQAVLDDAAEAEAAAAAAKVAAEKKAAFDPEGSAWDPAELLTA